MVTSSFPNDAQLYLLTAASNKQIKSVKVGKTLRKPRGFLEEQNGLHEKKILAKHYELATNALYDSFKS